MTDEPLDFEDLDRLEAELVALRDRHARLDAEISGIQETGAAPLQLMTLKREKLRLKDKIAWISARLTPDIIA